MKKIIFIIIAIATITLLIFNISFFKKIFNNEKNKKISNEFELKKKFPSKLNTENKVDENFKKFTKEDSDKKSKKINIAKNILAISKKNILKYSLNEYNKKCKIIKDKLEKIFKNFDPDDEIKKISKFELLNVLKKMNKIEFNYYEETEKINNISSQEYNEEDSKWIIDHITSKMDYVPLFDALNFFRKAKNDLKSNNTAFNNQERKEFYTNAYNYLNNNVPKLPQMLEVLMHINIAKNISQIVPESNFGEFKDQFNDLNFRGEEERNYLKSTNDKIWKDHNKKNKNRMILKCKREENIINQKLKNDFILLLKKIEDH